MKNIYFLLFITYITTCNAQEQKATGKTFDEFPVIEDITPQKLFGVNGIVPFHLMLYNDSLIIIRQDDNFADHHFSSFSLNSKSKVASIMRKGRKPGESLSFLSFGLLENKLWVFDLMKRKIIYTPISGNNQEYSELTFFNTNFYKVLPLTENIFICSGDHASDSRFEEVDLLQQKVIETYFPYPENYPQTQKEAYESFMFKQPDGNKYYLAARHADYLEFFNLDAGTKKVIYGPEGFGPSMSLFKDGEGQEYMGINTETRFGYVRGQTTRKYVYLLLSGNLRESENAALGKSIYVFDWEGNPFKRLNLKAGIVDFVVSSDDSTLYVYNPETRNIETTKL